MPVLAEEAVNELVLVNIGGERLQKHEEKRNAAIVGVRLPMVMITFPYCH